MSKIEVYNDLPDPPARKATRVEKFPFSTLEVGQGFTIAATAEKPKPWKSYQSTVSGAQRRFAEADGTKTRKNRKSGESVAVTHYKPTRKFKIYEGKLADGSSVAIVKRTA